MFIFLAVKTQLILKVRAGFVYEYEIGCSEEELRKIYISRSHVSDF